MSYVRARSEKGKVKFLTTSTKPHAGPTASCAPLAKQEPCFDFHATLSFWSVWGCSGLHLEQQWWPILPCLPVHPHDVAPTHVQNWEWLPSGPTRSFVLLCPYVQTLRFIYPSYFPTSLQHKASQVGISGPGSSFHTTAASSCHGSLSFALHKN